LRSSFVSTALEVENARLHVHRCRVVYRPRGILYACLFVRLALCQTSSCSRNRHQWFEAHVGYCVVWGALHNSGRRYGRSRRQPSPKRRRSPFCNAGGASFGCILFDLSLALECTGMYWLECTGMYWLECTGWNVLECTTPIIAKWV
jgi:hypothetical protein